jgi:phage tail tube protein FII
VQGFNTIRLDVLEAVNLFAGPIPTASLHLQLASMKLPEISQRFIEHAAGGSPVEIEVPVTVVKLTAGFTLAGWTPHVMAQALSGEQTFTCWGVLRDKRSGRAHQARAIIGGYLGKAEMNAFNKGQMHSIDYEIRGITHYDLTVGKQRVYFWDFYSQDGRTGDYGQDMRRAPFGFIAETRENGA